MCIVPGNIHNRTSHGRQFVLSHPSPQQHHHLYFPKWQSSIDPLTYFTVEKINTVMNRFSWIVNASFAARCFWAPELFTRQIKCFWQDWACALSNLFCTTCKHPCLFFLVLLDNTRTLPHEKCSLDTCDTCIYHLGLTG